MKTYEVLAHAFRAKGVEHAFGIIGDATLQWYAAMAGSGATSGNPGARDPPSVGQLRRVGDPDLVEV